MRFRLILPLLILAVLAGCQSLPFGTGGEGAATPAPSPITGAEIATTSLDGPSAPAPSASAATPATGAARPPEAAAAAPPEAAPPEAEAPEADIGAAEPVAPTVVKTEAHLACERRGGLWSVAGGGAAAFCQTPTRDAGKSCRASTDCTGYCLEKSRTCAPVTPMLGCHDILNEQGRMLTQCIN
ncbi:MAG: hypothetical protein MUC82_00860 [Cypionkella sp.]|jgi:hypothetical protein|nr:hypothetical protein [Cypionkella sp.]